MINRCNFTHDDQIIAQTDLSVSLMDLGNFAHIFNMAEQYFDQPIQEINLQYTWGTTVPRHAMQYLRRCYFRSLKAFDAGN